MKLVASGSTVQPMLPDVDIWWKAFCRQDPDPAVVHAFAQAVRDRRVFMIGWVRQALLARVRDERQFARLAWVLSAFPDLPLLPRDHERAAGITRRMREIQIPVSAWSTLVWAVAERLDGVVWSRERHWQSLSLHGCPIWRAESSHHSKNRIREQEEVEEVEVRMRGNIGVSAHRASPDA